METVCQREQTTGLLRKYRVGSITRQPKKLQGGRMKLTKKQKAEVKLSNQRVINELLTEFTALNVVVDLKMLHVVTFNNTCRFNFYLKPKDFIRLYAGKEVLETADGMLTLRIHEDKTTTNNLIISAHCHVEKPPKFTYRRITLTTDYQGG
tara:strand:- start:1321 stop:1773 length:453 start_codon:yes stop_codon:yes gene_type:complete